MSSVLTIAEAAEDLKITESVVWGYHRRGQLAVMYTRNIGAGESRRGPRDARIDRAEWERFKQFLTVKRETPAASAEAKPEKPRRGRPAKGAERPVGSERWLKRFKAAAE